jgi:hypothetical protein
MQKRIALIVPALVLALLAASCGGDTEPTATTGATTTTLPPAAETGTSADLLGAAVTELLTNDTTFGAGHRFTKLFVVNHMDDGTPLTDAELQAVFDAATAFSPVEIIADAELARTENLEPIVPGAAIVTAGPIDEGDGHTTVDMALWCGGLCAIWLTYGADLTDAGWTITGPVGPIAIS